MALTEPVDGAIAPTEVARLDPLSDVLRTVKLTGALFFLVEASSPWGVEVPEARAFAPILLPNAQQVVSYHVVLDGVGWAGIPGGPSTRFEAGDILLFAHGDPYAMLSAPGQPPEFDAGATVAFFREMAAGRLPFVIPEGGGGPDGARFVCGYLGCDLRPFNPLLAALPPLLRLEGVATRRGDLLGRLVDLTLDQARRHDAGGGGLRLRLSELIFVELLRRHAATLPAGTTGWLAGLRDPALGRVLSMLHAEPARPWSLGELAGQAGLSRSVLAERFAATVGCPAMRYLALWRLQLAARRLADDGLTVAQAAHAVGYDSEAAFSRAFKRRTGLSPSAWRQRAVRPWVDR